MPNQPLTYFKAKIPNGDYEEVAKARFDHSKVGLFMGWDIPFLFSLGWDLTGMDPHPRYHPSVDPYSKDAYVDFSFDIGWAMREERRNRYSKSKAEIRRYKRKCCGHIVCENDSSHKPKSSETERYRKLVERYLKFYSQNFRYIRFDHPFPAVPSFASIGLVEANGVLIDWPWDRLRKATKDREASTVCSIQLYEENIRSMPSGDHVRVGDGRLVEMRKLLRPTDYKVDYNVLVPGSSYTITPLGTTMYKGRLYICLQSDDEIGFRCSSQRVASVVEEYIQRGDIFTIHADGIAKRRGFKEINARID
ncbi:hypothetical protein VTP01DRAFT_9301 [Rhizomucor pusillus]|uniref:uncharacterized protein n=1 Tax=Rhizomucor pusillus TaxID=4840 RepID=UPI0037427516